MNCSEYILKLIHKDNFIKKWIKGKYKEKSIIIYGNPGTGKTTIANYILKDFTVININIDFCKKKIILDDYLDMSLYKKSITMMFNSSNIYKAILFDDLNYIQNNDKQLFKSIINFSKKENKNHPIVYIFNSIKHKNIDLIYKRSYPINIKFNHHQYIDLTKKIFNNGEYDYDTLIQKSHYNLHNIKNNLEFYKTNVNIIQEYDKVEYELDLFMKSLFNKNIKEIHNFSQSDYIIIGLNILENCIEWIEKSKLSKKDKINLINDIYYHNYLGDIYLTKIHIYLDWDLIEHLITNIIVIPIILLNHKKVKITNINYNKYISKCIIYTHNRKLLTSNFLDYEILQFLYEMISEYYELKSDKKRMEIKSYISNFMNPLKVIEKFHKFYIPKVKKMNYNIFY